MRVPGLAAFWNRLHSTYWFLPAVITAGCVVMAVLLVRLDRTAPSSGWWTAWVYGGGPDGARALLSAIAGSTITVVSVTFSVLVVALTVSSQHFGPRLLNSFMRDRASQAVLGTFTGTFAYCLLVLRTVQGDGDRYDMFVPHMAVSAGVALTLVSVGTLIFYVHHVATSMQVSEITTRVVREFEESIDRVYPDRIGEGEADIPAPESPPAGAFAVASPWSGYVQTVDGEALLRTAADAGTVVWIVARPGAFVIEGAPLVFAAPPPQDAAHFTREVPGAFVFGSDRTSAQDVAFAAQQLVEVALRALSPGVNEPFTAMTCIDRLGQGLARLAARRAPAAARRGPDGAVRVIAEPRRLDDLLEEAVEPLLVNAADSGPVLERILVMLRSVATVARRAPDRRAIERLAQLAAEAGRDALDARVAARIAAAHEAVRQTLASSPLPPVAGERAQVRRG